jgi:mono/diheme cytochrome c family protein
MKKLALIAAAVVAGVVVVAAAALTFAFPRVGPARERTVEKTAERVERGHYLANHVTVCVDCHSSRDWSRFSGPVVQGTEGRGGEHFTRDFGFPGEFYAPNITPAGIARYTDGELERLITTGVTKEGRAIFPVMPYPRFARLCQEDVDAIIAYVRSLPAQQSSFPATQLDFPMSVIVKTIPHEVPRPPCPDAADEVARGRYMMNAAACAECHTPFEKGSFVEGMELAGGRSFPIPGGTVTSANLTPDDDTGTGRWTREFFIARIRLHGTGADAAPVAPGQIQTVMPWTMYAGMTDADLGAIYAYLRTVPAKRHGVNKWVPTAGTPVAAK